MAYNTVNEVLDLSNRPAPQYYNGFGGNDQYEVLQGRYGMFAICENTQTVYNYNSGTPAAITASGNSGDLDVRYFNFAALDVNVAGAVTGTTPTLQFILERKTPAGIYLAVYTGTNITAVASLSLNVGPLTGGVGSGTLGPPTVAAVLGQTIRLRWVVGGTTPSFGGTTITVQGT